MKTAQRKIKIQLVLNALQSYCAQNGIHMITIWLPPVETSNSHFYTTLVIFIVVCSVTSQCTTNNTSTPKNTTSALETKTYTTVETTH